MNTITNEPTKRSCLPEQLRTAGMTAESEKRPNYKSPPRTGKKKKRKDGSPQTTRNPTWLHETLDMTRDRKIKSNKKKGKGGLKLGNARQYSLDQKNSRLEFQSSGDVAAPTMGSVVDFSQFFESALGRHFTENIMSFVESIALFAYGIARARDIYDILVACIHLFKHYTKKNIIAADHFQNIEKLVGYLDFQDGRENLDSFRDILTNWTRIKSSPIIKKINRVFLYCAALGLYSGPTHASVKKIDELAQNYESNRLCVTVDFYHYILDLFHFVCDKTYSILYESKSVKELFVSSMDYDVWLSKADILVVQDEASKSTINRDPHEYLHTLREMITVGEEIYKYSCDLDPKLKNLVRGTTNKLRTIELKFLSVEAAQSLRKCPFAISIEGKSAAGKTKVAEAIHTYFGKLFGKPTGGSERFLLNGTTEFWDGFRTSCWSIFIDDAGMWNENLNMIDESILNIVRIVNNMPFMPNMASLEDKGKTPLACELVIITTNSPNLKANQYFSYPYAAARRIPYHIRPTPKQCDENGAIASSSANNFTAAEIPDDWTFDILTPVPVPFGNPTDTGIEPMQGKLVPIKGYQKITMRKLLEFIRDKSTEHRANQDKILEHSKTMKSLVLCDECRLPTNFCSCNETQAGISPVFFILPCDFVVRYLFTRILDYLILWNILPVLRTWMLKFCQTHYRARLLQLQERVKDTYISAKDRLKPLAITAVLFTMVGILLPYISSFGRVRQGVNFSTWGKSYPEMDERESQWKKDPYKVDTFDSTPQSLSHKALSPEKCKEILGKASAYLYIFIGSKRKFCRLLNLKGQVFITPNHCIPTGETLDCQIIRGTVQDRVGNTHKFKLSQSQIVRMIDKDLCLITIPSVTNGKSITNLFVKENAMSRGPVELLGRNHEGDVMSKFAPFSQIEEVRDKLLPCKKMQFWVTPGLKTVSGECGSILYRFDGMGLRILGIHQSISNGFLVSKACALPLTFEFINSLDLDNEIGVVQPQLGETLNEDVLITPVKDDSCLRSLDDASITIYGNIRSRNRPRSHVAKTLLCDDLLEMGYPLNFGKPEMSRLKPWMINIKQQVQADCKVDWDCLMEIKADMLNQWLTVPQKYKDEIRILDMDTAINGQPGVRFVDPIARSTSAGFPFCRSKKHFIHSVNCERGLDKIAFSDQIMDRVNWRLTEYRKGNRTLPVFRGSLKDEALPQRKLDSGKIRVFMGGPVDFTIAVRSLLLSFVRVAQKNKFVFEAAPGTEAQCVDWDLLYQHLTEYGKDRMIFGDFAGFDVTMRADFMRAAFDLIEDFHRACGASELHCKMIRAMSYDIVFPLVEFNGDLVQLNGKNPSGQPLTVTLNSIVNCMYMRYCYLKLKPANFTDTFSDHVKLITYGDDNGMGVSEMVPWFNHTSISRTLEQIGVTYTMADKVSESKEYINISEADFLKRKWRFEPETNTMLAPLETTSILKSLMIGVRSVNVTKYEHAAEIIRSAHMEFFWHGQNVFDEWDIKLKSLIQKHQLDAYLPDGLKTWKDYIDEYNERSSHFLIHQDGEHRIQHCLHCNDVKDNEMYSECRNCGMLDECMFCGDRSNKISVFYDLRVWMCDVCVQEHYLEDGEVSLGECFDILTVAMFSKENAEDRGDLLQEWMDRSLSAESASWLVWNGSFHSSVSSTITRSSSSNARSHLVFQNGNRPQDTNTNVRTTGSSQSGPASSATADVVENMAPSNDVARYNASQTVTFTETEPGEVMEFKPTSTNTDFNDKQNLELNKFFERPTLIKTLSWGSGGLSTTRFNPWTEFLTNSYIENKLQNYSLFRGDLHIKLVITANPFTYGCALMSYTPLYERVTDSIAEATGAIQNSQKPHIFIWPQNNAGGEMVLPFFYNRQYVDVLTEASVDELGEIAIEQVIALDTANDVAIPTLTMQIYAWCSDVHLSGPTTQLVLQAGGDEYSSGPIERIATKVAGISAALTTVPMIEPFAIATSIASTAVAGIASLFGWSKVALIEGAHAMVIRPYKGFVSSEVCNSMDKFALDQKAELSVDPRIVNLTGQDELALNYLLQKECYINNSNWLASDAVGDQLFEFPVWPMIYRSTDDTTHHTLQFSPMAYFGLMCRYWRGDIVFRFRLVASQYHRGRIKITYEPKGEVGSGEYSNVAITKIVDITEENDIEFTVPYMQEYPWCKTLFDPTDGTGIGYVYDKTGSCQHYNAFTNGTIKVQVLTTLSSPQASPSCHIIAFVRGGENLELAVPYTDEQIEHHTTHLELQSGESNGDIVTGQQYDKRYFVNFGEQIVSLRQILSRSVLSNTYAPAMGISSDSGTGMTRYRFTRFPRPPGYNTNAYLTSESIISTGNKRFSFSLMHPINWVATCYAGMRGGLQLNVLLDSDTVNCRYAKLTRNGNALISANHSIQEGLNYSAVMGYGGTQSDAIVSLRDRSFTGSTGVILSNHRMDTIAAELTDQNAFMFNGTRQETWLLGSYFDDSNRITYQMDQYLRTNAADKRVKHEHFFNIAPDFNLHFFICTPTVYYAEELGLEPES